MNIKLKETITLSLILIFSISISLPLLKPGLFTMHDDQQVARLFLYDRALKAGQIPPRWVDELGFGFGYPLFIFYPPFVYMTGELFHLIGLGFIDSIKLIFFLSIFLSGVTIYILSKEFFGRTAALVSAIFYMLVPYRALDVYVRGALAESFAFIFLPIIFYTFYKLSQSPTRANLLLSSIFLALLMITHNLVLLPFLFFLIPYLLFLICKSQTKKDTLISITISVILSALLSAFFWIPSLLEKKYTIVDQLLLVNLASYNLHFVYPQQLWNWPWGFGGSAGLASGISFKIGKLHIILAVASMILSIIYLFKNKSLSTKSRTIYQLSVFSFCFFLFAAFMTTFYSKVIWDVVKPLDYLQFPWRFLIFTAFFSSFLAGAFIYLIKLPVLRIILSIVLVILLIYPNFKLFKPQFYRLDLTDQKATDPNLINWEVSSSSFEYSPKGIKLKVGELGTNLIDLKKEDLPKQKIEPTSYLKITNLNENPNHLTFTANASYQSQIQINTFNFPTWVAKVDNKVVGINDNNKFKLITLPIPDGSHQVDLQFKNTPLRNMANIISLLSILSLPYLYFKKWQRA